MKKYLLSCVAMATICLVAIPASASTFNFGNSEYILIQSSGISWDEAKLAAENSGGHLATITSAEESDFIKNNVLKDLSKAYWLGGYQTGDENRQTPTADWNWVTGEEWNFTDWSNIEPNNAGTNEIHLSADSRYGFQWNDEDSAVTQQIRGYVVEKPLSAPTPIPGAVWLLGSALAAVFGLKRKFGK